MADCQRYTRQLVHRIVNHNACPTRKLAHTPVLADPGKTIATAAGRMYIRRLARVRACYVRHRFTGTSGTNQRATYSSPKVSSERIGSQPQTTHTCGRRATTFLLALHAPLVPTATSTPDSCCGCFFFNLRTDLRIPTDRPSGRRTDRFSSTHDISARRRSTGWTDYLADYVRRASGRD
jgi:hypothetical protein